MNWPAVMPPTLPPELFPVPRVDIYRYTRGAQRRMLYISDVLRAQPPQPVPAGYDYSAHDFRLAPSITDNPTGTPNIRNPLVNQGFDVLNNNPPLWPLQIAGFFHAHPPGLPPGSEECPVHAWDWDAEGLGNRRHALPANFPAGIVFFQGSPAPPALTCRIDIGADELDELVMAGYVPGTRMYYAHPVPGQPSTYLDQSMVLFFKWNGVAASYPRPVANAIVGGRIDPTISQAYDWFPHKTVASDADQGNYTSIPAPFVQGGNPGRAMVMSSMWPSNPYAPISRAMECDCSGTLLPDLFPRWWSQRALHSPFPTWDRDEYGSNPWFVRLDSATSQPINDPFNAIRFNPALYHNISADSHHVYKYTYTSVVDATTCPPGATLAGGIYIDPGFGIFQFGPWAPCSGGASTYAVGAWGYGDTGANCPDRIPYFAGLDNLGIRWNCQAEGTNLQTFLSVALPVPGLPSASVEAGRQPAPKGAFQPYTPEAVRSFLRNLRR